MTTTIHDSDLQHIAETYGTPCYVYDAEYIRTQCRLLQQTLADDFDLHYSIKANPSLAIAYLIKQQGLYAEIASDGELHLALAAGYTPQKIIFAGPGKTEQELRAAIQTKMACINVESVNELQLLNTIAEQEQHIQTIGLRINPAIEHIQQGKIINAGGAQKFGIDEEQAGAAIALAQQLPFLNLQGLHYSIASQVQHHEDFLDLCRVILHSATRLIQDHDFQPSLLNFGGGIGVPHQNSDADFDLSAFQRGFNHLVSPIKKQGLLNNCRFVLELGRFIVSAAGVYLAQVIDTKTSQDIPFAILDGGINHALLPITANQYRIKKVPCETISCETNTDDITHVPRETKNKTNNPQEVMLGGPLCTSVDSWRTTVSLPKLHNGDLVIIENSGAYGLSASMLGFLSRQMPAEVLLDKEQAHLIRKRSDVAEVLNNQLNPINIT